MAEVHGSCDDRFGAVTETLERNLEGDELGASVAVDLDGRRVVDLWGGAPGIIGSDRGETYVRAVYGALG
jgi:hypothetical protein